MNLIQFHEAVQTGSEELSQEQLQNLVRLLALEVPEAERSAFLEVMLEARKRREAVQLPELASGVRSEVVTRVREILPRLKEIATGERGLDSTVDWDVTDDSDEEIIYDFLDKEDVLPDINTALSLVRACIDCGLYDLGWLLAGQLMHMDVQVAGEYAEYEGEPLNLSRLEDQELLAGSYVALCTAGLYLAYMGNELSMRPAAVYEMMQRIDGYRPKLEEVRLLGDGELPGLDDFLPLWLAYLASLDENLADGLLKDMLDLEMEPGFLSTLVRDFGTQHPRLHVDLLERFEAAGEWEEMLLSGREAVESQPVEYRIRGDIALIAARAAVKLDQTDLAEEFWFAAFQSDCSINNYLRLRFGSRDWSRYAGRVRAVYENAWKAEQETDHGYYVRGSGVSLSRNHIRRTSYLAMLLFDERFEEAFDPETTASSGRCFCQNLLSRLTPMPLLFFFQGSNPGPGLRAMLRSAVTLTGFSAAACAAGGNEVQWGTNEEMLWSYIQKWRAAAGITAAERERWLEVLETAIRGEVDSVLGKQIRDSYAGAAALLAALGEVQESCGLTGRKQELIRHVRSRYPRLRLFKRELESYERPLG